MSNKLSSAVVEFNTDDCYIVNEKFQLETFCMRAQMSFVQSPKLLNP